MDESVCDFCSTDYSESLYQGTTKLAYTGDQPPVYVCSPCLVEGTLKWQRGDFESNIDEDIKEQVLRAIYGRGLDIKVNEEDRSGSLKLGEIPD